MKGYNKRRNWANPIMKVPFKWFNIPFLKGYTDLNAD